MGAIYNERRSKVLYTSGERTIMRMLGFNMEVYTNLMFNNNSNNNNNSNDNI